MYIKFLFFIHLIFSFICSTNLSAKVYTVDSMIQFHDALKESQFNNENNYIYLKSNLYSGSLVYSSENTSNLTIKPVDDTENSNITIDAAGSTCPLSISSKGQVKILNLSIINGTSSLGGLNINTSGSVEIYKCQISKNTSGGGLRIDTTGNATIKDCIIQNNSSSTYGGGVYVKANNINVENNIISSNYGKFGGGIYIHSTNNTLFNKNVVKSNTINGSCVDMGRGHGDAYGSVSIGGGGIYVRSTTLTLTNNKISENTVAAGRFSLGGGLYTYCSGTTVISENVISKNLVRTADWRYHCTGAGIYACLINGDYIVKNNTIAENSGRASSNYGIGIHFSNPSQDKNTIIVNNIIWGNKNTWDTSNVKIDDLYIYKSHQNLNVWHNIYKTIRVEKTDYPFSPISTKQSNPLFVNSEMNDYKISISSPAIDSGTTESIEVSETDIIGNNRIIGKTIDVGAYEYSNKVLPPFFEQSESNFVPLYVTIACETPDAQIRFTLDNTIPDSTSLLYSDPLYITVATTITAKAFMEGMDESDAISATYLKKENINTNDSDHDGVIDQYDECPSTLTDKATYSDGCIAHDIYDQINRLTDTTNQLIHKFDIGKDNLKGLPEAIDALKTVSGINRNDSQLYTAEGMYLYNSESKILMLNIQTSSFPDSSDFYIGILQYEVQLILQSSINLIDKNSNQINWVRDDEGDSIIGEWIYKYNNFTCYINISNGNSFQIYVKNS